MSFLKRAKSTKPSFPPVEVWYRVSFSNVHARPHSTSSPREWRGVTIRAHCLITGSDRKYTVRPPEAGVLPPELRALADKGTSVVVAQSVINPIMVMFVDRAVLESDQEAYDALTTLAVGALLEALAPSIAKMAAAAQKTAEAASDAHAERVSAVKEKYGLA